jgi:hypothetical protein
MDRRAGGRTDGQIEWWAHGKADGRPGRTAGRTDQWAGGWTAGCTDGRAGGRTDGLAGGQDKEHMRRLLTSTGCREEVVAEVCAAAYSVMPPPGRAARTDSDQERTVRLASKTRMNDKSKQNKS